jgi:hypothetical protein
MMIMAGKAPTHSWRGKGYTLLSDMRLPIFHGNGQIAPQDGIRAVFVCDRKGDGIGLNASTRIFVPSEDKALLL